MQNQPPGGWRWRYGIREVKKHRLTSLGGPVCETGDHFGGETAVSTVQDSELGKPVAYSQAAGYTSIEFRRRFRVFYRRERGCFGAFIK